jgi:hypothetical protein
MTSVSTYVRWLAITTLAAALAAPAVAAPTIEQMKGDSGLRFNEGAGIGQLARAAAPVWAGGAPGRRANFAVQTPTLSKKDIAPPSPTPPAPGSDDSGKSLGTKILMGLGAVAGVALTVGLALLCGPAPLVLLGIGGAVAAASQASSNGVRGWSLAKQTAVGAGKGIAALGLIGVTAGLGVGRFMERLFGK